MLHVIRVRRAAIAAAVALLGPLLLIGRPGDASIPTFADPIALPASSGITEPGIDIAPDGTIFVHGIQGLPVHSKVWRSGDGGQTYDPLTFNTPYNRYPGGGDSDVAVTDDQRVYFLDLSAVSNSIARSEDNGQTWVEGTPFTTLPLSDRQWIGLGGRDDVTGRDTVYVVYHFIQPPQNLMFARSTDGGLTWTWHTNPVDLAAAIPGHLVSDGDFVAFNYMSRGVVYLVYSLDAGTTWERAQVSIVAEATTPFMLTGLAMDGDHMYTVWVDRYEQAVRVARSTDRGATWDENILTVSDGGTAVFPWVAARDGKVAVSWYGADNATGDSNGVPASTEWRIKYVETTSWDDGFTTPVDASQGVVKLGAVCTAGLSCSSGRELGDFHQLAIDADGKALITYVDLVCDPFCRGVNVAKQL